MLNGTNDNTKSTWCSLTCRTNEKSGRKIENTSISLYRIGDNECVLRARNYESRTHAYAYIKRTVERDNRYKWSVCSVWSIKRLVRSRINIFSRGWSRHRPSVLLSSCLVYRSASYPRRFCCSRIRWLEVWTALYRCYAFGVRRLSPSGGIVSRSSPRTYTIFRRRYHIVVPS